MSADRGPDLAPRPSPDPAAWSADIGELWSDSPSAGRIAGSSGPIRRWAVLPLGVVVAIVVFLGATVIHVPYYAISPGSIRDTSTLLELSGLEQDPDPAADADADEHGDRGAISFATVSLDGPVNLLQALSAGFDSTIELADEELILQGQTPADNQAANQQLMDGSKDVAVRVALTELGLAEPVGAEVELVVSGSPAAGVLSPGDVVLAAKGEAVWSAMALARTLGSVRPGDQIELVVAPTGSRPSDPARRDRLSRVELDAAGVTRTITVGRAPNQPESPYLGIAARDALLVSFDGDIAIDSSGVGGPSAGLAFTLAVIDRLSAGDLTGGDQVAATGTMDAFGRVGPIGGIEQKAVAAARAGMTVFLVPDSLDPAELARARKKAVGVELVPVGTVTEALAALDERRNSR